MCNGIIFARYLMRYSYLIVWVVLLRIPLLSQGDKDTCVNCHKIATPKIVEEHSKSVHNQADLGCVSCHGGNDKDDDEENAHSTVNFKGKIVKKDIPLLCNNCHGDINLMKTFRLNANVYNEYLTSRHGKLLMEKSDSKVATCTDCHNVHNILSKKNPLSSTYKLNISTTCSQCHADKEYMKEYNISTTQFEEYSTGIHGQILHGRIEGKNPLLVPTCVDCHGVHGAVPPEVTSVHFICGTCHFEVLQYFKLSPHFNSLRLRGSPKCIDCHGNHKNSLPSGGLLLSSEKGGCGFCHSMDKENEILTITKGIQQMILDIQSHIQGLETMVRDYPSHKYPEIFNMAKTNLEKVQKSLSHLQKISHSLDIKLIEDDYNNIITLVNSTNVFKERFLSKEKEWSFALVLTFIVILLFIVLIFSFFVAKFILGRLKK